jgi:hypothetical protein
MLPLWTRNQNRRGEDARKLCEWRHFVGLRFFST